jgi:hypothetical protein
LQGHRQHILNAKKKKRYISGCGLEFRPDLEGRIAIIKKNIFELKSSRVQWHAHIAKTINLMGFNPARFNCNVWIRKREVNHGYDYKSTYLDDFLITA